MRLSTRLERLETSVTGKLTAAAAKLLVQLLARRDALFWPSREHGSFRPEIRRIAAEYISGTGGLRAAGQGESNWKASHHARNELLACGLCSSITSGGQVTALRLTPQGVADARALIGDRLRTIADGMQLLERLSGHWTSESDLFGIELTGAPSEWEVLIDYTLPLLAVGIIESNSDLHNRAYFRRVEGVEIDVEPSSSLACEPWADSEYLSSFDAERAALRRLEATDGGIVIPIRCS